MVFVWSPCWGERRRLDLGQLVQLDFPRGQLGSYVRISGSPFRHTQPAATRNGFGGFRAGLVSVP